MVIRIGAKSLNTVGEENLKESFSANGQGGIPVILYFRAYIQQDVWGVSFGPIVWSFETRNIRNTL